MSELANAIVELSGAESTLLNSVLSEFADDEDRKRLRVTIDNPTWDTVGHDWTDYVPATVRQLWPKMTLEARLTAYLIANDWAENTWAD